MTHEPMPSKQSQIQRRVERPATCEHQSKLDKPAPVQREESPDEKAFNDAIEFARNGEE